MARLRIQCCTGVLAACQAGIRKVRHLDLANLYVRSVTEEGLIRVQYVESSKKIDEMNFPWLLASATREILRFGRGCAPTSNFCLCDPPNSESPGAPNFATSSVQPCESAVGQASHGAFALASCTLPTADPPALSHIMTPSLLKPTLPNRIV